MTFDKNRAFDFLNKMAFVREAGSPEELKTAEMIRDELAGFGVSAVLEEFEIEDAIECSATLEVLEPYRASYPVTAYKCSANTPEDGLTAEFIYAEDGLDADLTRARGKIVLVNGYLRLPLYRQLVKAGAVAFVTMTGALLDKEEESDLFTRMLRASLRSFGTLPGANLRIRDAFELVERQACKVCLKVHNKPIKLSSHNVVATLPGTQKPEEIVSFGAHFDSVPFSTGVYDNGAGSVILLELARYFAQNPPLRTVQLMWYGSEEIGLEGSKAFVRQHADELKNHVLMINVDVGGPVLGYEVCHVTANEELGHYLEYFSKIHGSSLAVRHGIYSSDSVPFADAGVPALNFCRVGAPGGAYIHCRDDIMRWLSPEGLEKTGRFVLMLSSELINAAVFPVKRTIPADITEELNGYLYKKELEEARTEAEAAAK